MIEQEVPNVKILEESYETTKTEDQKNKTED